MTVTYFLCHARPARTHIAGTLGWEMFRRPTLKGPSSVTPGRGRKSEAWRIPRENPQPGGLHIGSSPIPSHATSTSCGTASAFHLCVHDIVVQPSRLKDRSHTYARCRPYVLHLVLLSQRPFRTAPPHDFSARRQTRVFCHRICPARFRISLPQCNSDFVRRPTLKGSSSVTPGRGRKSEAWRIPRENPQPGGLHIGSSPIPSHATSASCGTASAFHLCVHDIVVQPSRLKDRSHTYARCRHSVLHLTLLSQRPFRTESPLHAAPRRGAAWLTGGGGAERRLPRYPGIIPCTPKGRSGGRPGILSRSSVQHNLSCHTLLP